MIGYINTVVIVTAAILLSKAALATATATATADGALMAGLTFTGRLAIFHSLKSMKHLPPLSEFLQMLRLLGKLTVHQPVVESILKFKRTEGQIPIGQYLIQLGNRLGAIERISKFSVRRALINKFHCVAYGHVSSPLPLIHCNGRAPR
jgi:hypothetical protein